MINFIDGDVLVYRSMWGTDTLGEAQDKITTILQQVVESTFSDDYLIALGGDTNWRETFFADYKKSPSRLASKKNKAEYHEDLKLWFRKHSHSVTAEGFEADDLLRMWATQAKNAEQSFIVSSIDKDLDCIPGLHYNISKDLIYTVTEDDGNHHYWKQILMGDSVDNIPGLPKVGPVKAESFLEGCTNNEERKEAVINAYKDKYEDNWKEYLLCNGRLIHIWRHYGDHFMV
jgi:5'-3' exonuclease